MTNEKLNLTQEWDKGFPKATRLTTEVTFHNRYHHAGK